MAFNILTKLLFLASSFWVLEFLIIRLFCLIKLLEGFGSDLINAFLVVGLELVLLLRKDLVLALLEFLSGFDFDLEGLLLGVEIEVVVKVVGHFL